MIGDYSNIENSESAKIRRRLNLARAMGVFRNAEMISFDIFDTLIFRPFQDPKDLFYLLGERFEEIDFYNLRIRCEREAREIRKQEYGDTEINIYDIYERINYYTGLDVNYGIKTEFELEMSMIYVNKHMKYIFDTLKENNVTIVLVSDMYYPEEMLTQLLNRVGISGYDKLYVSCDVKKSKYEGTIWQDVLNDFQGIEKSKVMHIDDNWNAIQRAREYGILARHYPSNKALTGINRPAQLSPVIGSIYKGIINNYIASDEMNYPVPYELGYIYGGFFLLGYCSYIHKECVKDGVEKVLFMSRDGDIMKQVWDYLFDDISSEYLMTSRESTMRISVCTWKKLFIESAVDRMSTRKKSKTIGEVLESIGLSLLKESLYKYGIDEYDYLSYRDDPEKVSDFRDFIVDHIDKIEEIYSESNELYADYLKNLIDDCHAKIALVDVGWRGVNGYAITKFLAKIRSDIKCYNFLVGSPQTVNLPQIRTDEIRTYMFSSQKNMGIYNKHKSLKYNMFYELITMSASPSFKYFYKDNVGKIKVSFGEYAPENYSTVLQVHRGILDFIRNYTQKTNGEQEFLDIPEDDVAEVLCKLFSQPDYFKNNYSHITYSCESGEDKKSRLTDWID